MLVTTEIHPFATTITVAIGTNIQRFEVRARYEALRPREAAIEASAVPRSAVALFVMEAFFVHATTSPIRLFPDTDSVEQTRQTTSLEARDE